MSAVHVTFLWPVIITEMVLVFSAMEHELAMEQPEFRLSGIHCIHCIHCLHCTDCNSQNIQTNLSLRPTVSKDQRGKQVLQEGGMPYRTISPALYLYRTNGASAVPVKD
jgi:hypothetical protein